MFSKDPAIPVSRPETSATIDLAPRWHTALLVGVILAVALTGTLLSRWAPVASGSRAPIATAYVPGVVVAWAMAFYVCRLGRASNAMRSLLGRGWGHGVDALGDVALAALGWTAIEVVELVFARTGLGSGGDTLRGLLPSTTLERGAWVVFAMSVGFCEEVVYRGYLQTQLGALTRRPGGGIALQAALFGVAHLEQGAGTAARLAVYGLGLGILARWRRSLWPGILCHVAVDLASGLLRS